MVHVKFKEHMIKHKPSREGECLRHVIGQWSRSSFFFFSCLMLVNREKKEEKETQIIQIRRAHVHA